MHSRVSLFNNELGLLSPAYRDFVVACINCAPAYVFTNCPSSSTDKYHPPDELGPDGTVRHTRKVVAVANALVTAMGISHYRDIVIAAAIIHDLRKQGLTRSGHTVRHHAALAADLVNFVAGYYPGIIPARCARLIASCVGFHYGPWGTGAYAINSLYDLSLPALAVHAADYIASRRYVNLNINL